MNFKDFNGQDRRHVREMIKKNQKTPFFGKLVYQERMESMKKIDKLCKAQQFPDQHNYNQVIRESMQNLRDLQTSL